MLALAVLFGALALFWLSTRQFAVIARVGIWIAGAGLLAWAATSATTQNEFGLWSAFGDAWEGRDHFRDTAIYRAFSLNLETVIPFLKQLSDFFVVAAVVLAGLSLLAFTPGEAIERFLRPSIFILAGFISGSLATLAVVAIGFGGYSKPRVFTSDGEQVRVHDGDTFWIGEHSMRLFGADAPEGNQKCHRLPDENCGTTARDYLAALIADRTLQCDQMLSRESKRPRDSFGRALVRCWLTDGDARIDLAEQLIRTGYAVQYEGDDYGYGAAETAARASRSGLLSGCWLRPDIQRSRQRAHQAAREAFARGEPLGSEIATVGECSVADGDEHQ